MQSSNLYATDSNGRMVEIRDYALRNGQHESMEFHCSLFTPVTSKISTTCYRLRNASVVLTLKRPLLISGNSTTSACLTDIGAVAF